MSAACISCEARVSFLVALQLAVFLHIGIWILSIGRRVSPPVLGLLCPCIFRACCIAVLKACFVEAYGFVADSQASFADKS